MGRPVEFQRLDYFYYTALTVAALYENASASEKETWRDLLAAHREQLREWAENYPPTFADKHALVSAEIARIEGRELDAKRLYEQAIRSAHDHGFVQNEALAYEAAARFYSARGFETFSNAYLGNAQVLLPPLGSRGQGTATRATSSASSQISMAAPTATIGSPVRQLDVGAS